MVVNEVIEGSKSTVTVAVPLMLGEGARTWQPLASRTLSTLYVVVTRGDTTMSAPLI